MTRLGRERGTAMRGKRGRQTKRVKHARTEGPKTSQTERTRTDSGADRRVQVVEEKDDGAWRKGAAWNRRSETTADDYIRTAHWTTQHRTTTRRRSGTTDPRRSDVTLPQPITTTVILRTGHTWTGTLDGRTRATPRRGRRWTGLQGTGARKQHGEEGKGTLDRNRGEGRDEQARGCQLRPCCVYPPPQRIPPLDMAWLPVQGCDQDRMTNTLVGCPVHS